jgi:hypothetical protein
MVGCNDCLVINVLNGHPMALPTYLYTEFKLMIETHSCLDISVHATNLG